MRVSLSTISPVHIGSGIEYLSRNSAATATKDGRAILSREDAGRLPATQQGTQRGRSHRGIAGDPFLTDVYRPDKIPATVNRQYIAMNNAGNGRPWNVRECIKTSDVPYIPGSSLKGAIRTALFWSYAKDDDRFAEIIRADRGDRNKIGKQYEESVFSCNTKSDPKYDLLRFLQVADCMPERQILSIETVKTYSLRQGRLAEKKFEVLAECVQGTFAGSIGGLDQIRAVSGSRDFPGLKDRLQALFGMSAPSDTGEFVPHLNRTVAAWSRWCLKKESELAGFFSDEAQENAVLDIGKHMEKGICIRLGFGVGTLYQTLIGLLEERDPGLAAGIVRRLYLQKSRNAPGGYGSGVPYPKTLELTAANRPLGWVELSIADGVSP